MSHSGGSLGRRTAKSIKYIFSYQIDILNTFIENIKQTDFVFLSSHVLSFTYFCKVVGKWQYIDSSFIICIHVTEKDNRWI